ncbi:MAG: hypothetical protein WCO56_19180 [Verrucomicrobiota bacterium]
MANGLIRQIIATLAAGDAGAGLKPAGHRAALDARARNRAARIVSDDDGDDTEVPYPLTLTLSLGERKIRSPRMDILKVIGALPSQTDSTPDAKDPQITHNPLPQPQNGPPLPEGEERGEGV